MKIELTFPPSLAKEVRRGLEIDKEEPGDVQWVFYIADLVRSCNPRRRWFAKENKFIVTMDVDTS